MYKIITAIAFLGLSVSAAAQSERANNRPENSSERAERPVEERLENPRNNRQERLRRNEVEPRGVQGSESYEESNRQRGQNNGNNGRGEERRRGGEEHRGKPAEMSGREWGELRSTSTPRGQQPRSEEEARELIQIIHKENEIIIESNRELIEEAEERLEERRSSGEIPEREYEEQRERLRQFKERQREIEGGGRSS